MTEPFFVGVEEVLYIHSKEIEAAGGNPGIRDLSALEAAVLAPQATHGGEYLLDLFFCGRPGSAIPIHGRRIINRLSPINIYKSSLRNYPFINFSFNFGG